MLAAVPGEPNVNARRGLLPRKFSALLARQPLSWWAIGLAVVALAVSGLFGGLDPVAKQSAPITAAGTVIDGGPWRVTVVSANLLADTPPLVLRNKANRWVVVRATVEITADSTWTDVVEIINLSGVEGVTEKEPRGMLLLRGQTATNVGMLHPNMPEDVAFYWEQAATAAVPTEATITVTGKTNRPDSFSGSLFWALDDRPRATLMLPVLDKRNAG